MFLLEWKRPQPAKLRKLEKRQPTRWERATIDDCLRWRIVDAFKLSPTLSAVKENGEWLIADFKEDKPNEEN